jgi:signal transduction histidine kinase
MSIPMIDDQPRPAAGASDPELPDDESMLVETFVHDLGNLVQIAASAINVVARDPGITASSSLDRSMAEARAALDRAGALIRESLDARFTGTQGDVDIEDCLDGLRPLLERLCGATIHLDLRAERLPKIACRRIDLENAILNLCLNARDAMPGSGVLSIAADVADGPEIPEIQVVVADTGIGMPPQLLAVVPQPFFTTKPEGRGIGLTSVSRFVARAGGRLLIDSKPGVGTSVTMRLPAAGSWLLG